MFGLFAKKKIEREAILILYQKHYEEEGEDKKVIKISKLALLSYLFNDIFKPQDTLPAIISNSSISTSSHILPDIQESTALVDDVVNNSTHELITNMEESVSITPVSQIHSSSSFFSPEHFKSILILLHDRKHFLRTKSEFISSSSSQEFIQQWKLEGFHGIGNSLKINFAIFKTNFPEKKMIMDNLFEQTQLLALSLQNCEKFNEYMKGNR